MQLWWRLVRNSIEFFSGSISYSHPAYWYVENINKECQNETCRNQLKIHFYRVSRVAFSSYLKNRDFSNSTIYHFFSQWRSKSTISLHNSIKIQRNAYLHREMKSHQIIWRTSIRLEVRISTELSFFVISFTLKQNKTWAKQELTLLNKERNIFWWRSPSYKIDKF